MNRIQSFRYRISIGGIAQSGGPLHTDFGVVAKIDLVYCLNIFRLRTPEVIRAAATEHSRSHAATKTFKTPRESSAHPTLITISEPHHPWLSSKGNREKYVVNHVRNKSAVR